MPGERVQKWWKPLYEKKGADRKYKMSKQGDFAALVEVKYKESDIKKVKLLHVVDLDRQDGDSIKLTQ